MSVMVRSTLCDAMVERSWFRHMDLRQFEWGLQGAKCCPQLVCMVDKGWGDNNTKEYVCR
jgi:hypothetical protein